MIWAAAAPALARYGPALALVAGVGLAGWWAYGVVWQRGWDAREAIAIEQAERKQTLIDGLEGELREASARLNSMIEAQSNRAMEIEDEIRANPDKCRRITPDSLRRLKRRWGQ